MRGGWEGGHEQASGSVGEGSETDEGDWGITDESRPNGPVHGGMWHAGSGVGKSEEGQAGDCKCRGVHRW